SRGQLIAQLLVESALLAGTGLALGLILTFWGIHLLSASIVPNVGQYIVEPQTSWRVLAFAIVTSIVCLTLVGLVPAVRVSRVDPIDLMKSGAGTGAHKRNQRRYGILVVAQIALALALLSSAAVVFRQAWRVQTFVRFGFDPKPLAYANQFITLS